jgi:hypothetical protein
MSRNSAHNTLGSKKFNETYSERMSSDNSLDSSEGRKRKKMKRSRQRNTFDDKDKLNQRLADIDSE